MSIRSFFLSSAVVASSIVASATGVATGAAPDKAAAPSPSHDGSRDFDFLYGAKWKVHNRRLAKRMAGSTEWIEFEAVDEFHPLAGNLGQEETLRTEYWPGFVGVAFHMYEADEKQWALYWVDNRNAPGTLQTPLRGSFVDGVGTFYGADVFDGKPIDVRYYWKDLGKDHASWEQAFSADGGKTWETNWTMDFTR